MNAAPPIANDTCAHDRCECVVSGEDKVARGGRTYCSEGCARGEGCEHAVCDCRHKPPIAAET